MAAPTSLLPARTVARRSSSSARTATPLGPAPVKPQPAAPLFAAPAMSEVGPRDARASSPSPFFPMNSRRKDAASSIPAAVLPGFGVGDVRRCPSSAAPTSTGMRHRPERSRRPARARRATSATRSSSPIGDRRSACRARSRRAPVSVATSMIASGCSSLAAATRPSASTRRPSRVGVEHLDGLAAADAQHVVGPDRRARRQVLGEAQPAP